MTVRDPDDTIFMLPSASSGTWEDLTPNERAWIEFIRAIACGSDPRVTPARVRALRDALDIGREGLGPGSG